MPSQLQEVSFFVYKFNVFKNQSIFFNNNLQQQSMNQIPILINRKGSKSNQIAFKIFPLDGKIKVSHRRQKTYDSAEKPIYEQRKHDTLDTRRDKGQNRYRRATSSGGTKKFPKDFFKQNLPSSPIRIRISRSKKQNNSQSQAFSRLQVYDQNSINKKKQSKQYQLESPEVLCEQVNQVQTPKFNNKNLNSGQFFQAKSKTTNRKIKLQEYLTQKKQNFPVFFKNCKDLGFKAELNDKKNYNQQNRFLQDKVFGDNEVLLQTLGKKQNLIKQLLNPSKKLEIKRKVSKKEKQNCQEDLLVQKKSEKKIKQFLSTKGLNWKMVQKINNIKFKGKEWKDKQQKESPFHQSSNNSQIKQKLLEKQENFEGNTFRIRKY